MKEQPIDLNSRIGKAESQSRVGIILGGFAILLCALLTMAVASGKVHAETLPPPDAPANVEVQVDAKAQDGDLGKHGLSATSADTPASTPSETSEQASGHWYDPIANAYKSAKAKAASLISSDEQTSESPTDVPSSTPSESTDNTSAAPAEDVKN